jgi:acyl phosphate:glycerol-3-phosphate acyltransferase
LNIWVQLCLLMAGAYLLGSIPAAYLVSRWARGIDIRQVGTGNVGSSNVLQSTSSKWLALLVLVFDGVKGAFAVWIAQQIGFSAGMQMAVGMAAIAGHNWPLFLNFRGGKGIITSLGVIMMMSPWLGIIVAVMAYSLAPIKQLALGVFIGLLALPVLSWFLAGPLGIEDRLPVTLGFVALTSLAYIRRLTAPRSPLSAGLPFYKVLVFRLFFDRDIRDRRTWVERGSTG